MRRPVYGGAARIRRKEMAPQGNLAGGPGVPWTPGRRPPHRNGGTFGSFGHERTTIIRYVVKKMAAKPTQKLSNTANPARANKEKINARGAAGCGVPRKVTAPGKPASQFLQRPGRGRARDHPRCARCRRRKERGDARRAPARQGWAGADGRKYPAADQTPRGVQGSRGPLVGGRRIETAGPLVLSVGEHRNCCPCNYRFPPKTAIL